MNRLIRTALTWTLMAAPPALGIHPAAAELPSVAPYVTLLDMHPVQESAYTQGAKPLAMAMPRVVRQGESSQPDPRQIEVPAVVVPDHSAGEDQSGAEIGRAGTGFFVGHDGTLLTAAHVVKSCGRMQVISRYVPRTWASLVASDTAHDIAVLRVSDLRPPGVVHLASAAPSRGRLLVLGYPATASLTIPAETWALPENDKFPANIGPMANPRDLLWMSAPAVTHGYSGGPIFDPRQGAVVGIVKGEVDGGYLRLVRDMPTTGIAIGPGIEHIGALLRREAPYAAVNLVSSPGEGGQDTLRRATVHVLCWR